MQSPDGEWPTEQRRSSGAHLDHMAQNGFTAPLLDFKTMGSVETARSGKAKENRLAWIVLFDRVTDRAMPADGAHRQRAVKAHRGPFAERPQAILLAGK